MVQIIWTQRAITDLDSIAEYIAVDSEYAAQKFIQELIKKTNALLNYPEKDVLFQKILPGNTGKYFTRTIGLFIN